MKKLLLFLCVMSCCVVAKADRMFSFDSVGTITSVTFSDDGHEMYVVYDIPPGYSYAIYCPNGDYPKPPHTIRRMVYGIDGNKIILMRTETQVTKYKKQTKEVDEPYTEWEKQ